MSKLRDYNSATFLRLAVFLLLAMGLTAGLAWWLFRPGTGPPTAFREAARTPSSAGVPIVIYLIDTLRYDRLGTYGYSRRTSPNIDALAATSVVFDRAYAPAPWTLPSVASLVTSTFQCEHGVMRGDRKLSPRIPTLAEHLQSLGYRTGAFYNNDFAGPLSAVDRGYDVSVLRPEVTGFEADAAEFIRTAGDQPFFLYLHGMEVHEPHLVPSSYTRQLAHVAIDDKVRQSDDWILYRSLREVDSVAGNTRGASDNSREQAAVMARFAASRETITDLYDASVLWADDNVGKVIRLLKEQGLWERSIFIVLADHGEEFGEHGAWWHGETVYEPAMHVPLIMHLPGGELGGRRVAGLVSLTDVMPTLLDLLGHGALCNGCRGTSLVPLLSGPGAGEVDRTVFGLRHNELGFYKPLKQRSGDVNVLVRRDQWKAIWNAEPQTLELYDLQADPGEVQDLSQAQPELAAELRDAAVSWLDQCRGQAVAPENTTLDERTRERLKGLGYLH